jgi:2-isopropylmalate synthase
VEAGACCVNLPDTVGFSVPHDYAVLIGHIVAAIGDRAIVSVHCHNDLGLATANSLAAVVAGARQIECTINGIGERAGNCALEEAVMAMNVRRDVLPYETGIVTEHIFPASKLLTEIISFGPQPNKAIVGSNAFAHEAGIHQDGYLKERTTYEIMEPKSVGVPESRLVLGKHSGRHALRSRCEDLGYQLTREQLDIVYTRFVAIADRKKGVTDHEISNILQEVARRDSAVAAD